MLKPCKQKRVMSHQDLKPHRKPRIRDHIWGREKEEYKADQIRRMNVKKNIWTKNLLPSSQSKGPFKVSLKVYFTIEPGGTFSFFLLFLFTKQSKLNKTKTSLQWSAKQQQVYANKWYAAYLKGVHWTKREKKNFVLTVSVLQAIACSGVRYLRWEVLKINRKSRKHKR